MKNPQNTKALVFVFFVSLAFSLLFTLVSNPRLDHLLFSDALGYYKAGKNLKMYGIFSESSSPPLFAISFRTPLYPFLLAGIFGIFGYSSLLPVIIFQDLLFSLTVVMCWFTAYNVFGSRHLAYLSAGLVMFSLSFLASGQFLWTETTFIFLLMLSLVAGLYYFQKQKFLWLLFFSFITGLLPLCRPVAIYLPLIAFLVILVHCLRFRLHSRLKRISVALFLLLLPTQLWCLRNYSTFGDWYFCELGSFALRVYRANEVLSLAEGLDYNDLFRKDWERYWLQIYEPRRSPKQLSRALTKEAMTIFKRYPFQFLLMEFRGLYRILLQSGFNIYKLPLGLRSPDFTPSPATLISSIPWQLLRPTIWLEKLLLLCSAVLSFIAIVHLLWRLPLSLEKHSLMVLTALYYIYFLLVSAGTEATCRLRIPLVPLASLLVPFSVILISSFLRRRGTKC